MDQLDPISTNPLHSTRGQVLLYAHYQHCPNRNLHLHFSSTGIWRDSSIPERWSRKLSMRQRVFVDRAVFHDDQEVLVRVCNELNVL